MKEWILRSIKKWNLTKLNFLEILLFVLIVFSILKWVYPITDLINIDVDDETAVYMRWFKKDLSYILSFSVDVSWGPLYSLWYWMLSFAVADYYQLYFLSHGLIFSLLLLIYFFFLRRMNFDFYVSALCTFLLLLNPYILLIPRYPNHFVLLILITFFLLSSFSSKNFTKMLIIAFGCLLATYVRPEYCLGMPIVLAGMIYFYYKEFKHLSYIERTLPLIFTFAVIIMIKFWSFPVVEMLLGIENEPFNHNKAISTFFVKNAERLGKIIKDDPKVWEEMYGKATSISQAIYNNPTEFLKHLSHNIHEFFVALFRIFSSFAYLLKTWFGILSLLLSLFFLGRGLYNYLAKEKQGFSFIPPVDYFRIELVYYYILLTVPIFIACMLYGVLTQYLIGFLALLLPLIIQMIRKYLDTKSFKLYLITLLTLFLIIMPELNGSLSEKYLINNGFVNKSNLNFVNLVRKLQGAKELSIIVDNFDFCKYIPDTYRCQRIDEIVVTFSQDIRKKSVVLFLKDDIWRYVVQKAPTFFQRNFTHFVHNLSQYGFYSINLSLTHESVSSEEGDQVLLSNDIKL